MSKGILLFAFNNDHVDYYKMAIATAKRANHFLDLPVSVVTDESTDMSKYDYAFDNVYIQKADKSNRKGKKIWINKGRFAAYALSPYDETILLDTDYLINSDLLLTAFNLYEDFMCSRTVSFLMSDRNEQEIISMRSFTTVWATVVVFRKTQKTKQIFECLEMVQQNYEHYSLLYGFSSAMYRNDYALTIALRIVNGNTADESHYLPWNLIHAGRELKVIRSSTSPFNTAYIMMTTKDKIEYGIIKDIDFHLLDKDNFMELVDE